ncbi:B12-binding domain-containing radical SAM protein [Rossellomorea oryzaecorticis]|uniref:B12-binding domain-containing radical SAM protein n=1 Tax=Rossellomorea oryzaecorticis TaxID=1396505 RepID=A0ABW8VJL9_9BACI|nr:B12-binding domain-containing radical SAM protein [[Bacillus] enclensis]MBH9968935.1 B12-binding domain-containing radical SAM protein [[Bacillus] enclensis]QTC42190.1 B12-binding domain-containing radical SAM protein [Bacillus sp. V3]
MKKVVLSTLNAKYIHTNLAIRCLKAYIEPDYDAELAEYTIKDPILNIATDLFSKQPDVIGFSCYIWNIEETIKVIQVIRKILPDVKIVLGGPEVTYDVPYWLDRLDGEVDFIALGEGEETFKQFLDELHGGEDWSKVHGIAYLDNGKPVIKPQQNKIDLRDVPSPFRFEEDLSQLSKRVTYIETSRGCPFRCQFCLSSIEVGVRYFDREKVKEDIRFLMKNGAKTIKFVDRTFNISRSYAMEMFQFLIDEHLPGTVFQFEITADIMRPEVIEFLNKEAPPGLFRFEIGVQSTNDETNDLVMRKQNYKKLTRTVTMVKDGGKIDQHLDLIAGLPEEDYHSFRKTFNDVFELRPEELQLGFLKMLRGTGLRIRANDHQYIYMDHSPYEILGNNVLSFDDILKIKQVEDVLEKYWNDHRMDQTIEHLVTNCFETPFDFFQQFGSYWESRGWSRIGHQLEDLYKRLYEFLSSQEKHDMSVIEGLMKLDYLRNQKYKPRKAWWDHEMTKEDRSSVYQELLRSPQIAGEEFIGLNLSEKEIYKHTLLERIVSPDGSNQYVLAYYEPADGRSSLFLFDREYSI